MTTNLISVRRIIFTPNVELKDELKNTSIQITCLDEDGNVLKRVTSSDSGDVEDPEDTSNVNPNPNDNGNDNGNGNDNTGGNNQGGGDNGSIVDGVDEG